jgi:hypothetical protein
MLRRTSAVTLRSPTCSVLIPDEVPTDRSHTCIDAPVSSRDGVAKSLRPGARSIDSERHARIPGSRALKLFFLPKTLGRMTASVTYNRFTHKAELRPHKADFDLFPRSAVLQNRVYVGEITHKGQSYPGGDQGIRTELHDSKWADAGDFPV